MFSQRPDGTIVDENGVVATPEALQQAGIAVPKANQIAAPEIKEPTVESLQAELLQARQQSSLLQDKADGFDTMMGDKDFQQYAFNRKQRESGLQTDQNIQPQIQESIDYSKQFPEFEDGEAIGRIIDAITENVNKSQDERFKTYEANMTKNFEPLMNNLADNQQAAEFQALVSQAQQGKWGVDPNTIKKEIDFERQRIPNLSMNQAYDLVVAKQGRRDIVTKQPIQQQNQSGQNIQTSAQGGSPLIQPAGGSTTKAPATGDLLSNAVNERIGEKGAPVRRSTEEIINEAAQSMAEGGNPIDINSL